MELVIQQQDLLSKVTGALDIASKVIDLFGEVGYEDPANSNHNASPAKILAETCMLLYVANRLSEPAIHHKVNEISSNISRRLCSKKLMFIVAMTPNRAASILVAYEILLRLGMSNQTIDNLLVKCLESVKPINRDLRTVEHLEHKWCTDEGHDWVQGMSDIADWESAISASQLSKVCEVLSTPRDEMYFYTHEMFYSSDFGRQPDRVPGEVKRTMEFVASAFLAKSIEVEDYDLAAELLLCWPMCGLKWNAAADFSWRLLQYVENTAGILPGGSTDIAYFESVRGEERARYAIGSTYHTVYVSAMLSSAMLMFEPKEWNFTTDSLEETSSVACSLGGNIKVVIDQIAPEVRPGFEGFLLDIAICRAVREQKIYELSTLVRTAEERMDITSLLCCQANMLLGRMAQWHQMYLDDEVA